ncbi:MAG: hypothetical protein HKL88_08265 [Bacteroidia bacterium]|nr:hypothetical protein [Bacteroidia bacterium]
MITSKPVRIILIVLTGFLFYSAGYFRNYIFLFLNAEAFAVWYHRPIISPPAFLGFVSTLGYPALVRLKWAFTFLFYILFFLLALAAVSLFFRQRIYLWLCSVVYAGLLLISFMFMISGYLFHGFAIHAYNISRSLIHIGQSPFLPMLLLITIYYHRHAYSAENRQKI